MAMGFGLMADGFLAKGKVQGIDEAQGNQSLEPKAWR